MTVFRRSPLILLTSAILVLTGRATALAQETTGAGRTEIVTAVFGGGAVFMPSATAAGSVTNNVLVGVTVTRNLTPRLGVEGDLTVALGRHDAHLLYGTVGKDQQAPNMLFYGATVVYGLMLLMR